MSRTVPIVPFVLVAALAGCGSSSSSTSSSPAASSASTGAGSPASAREGQLGLSETEFKITPATEAVRSTGTITIDVTNSGTLIHALAVQTPSGIVRTASISPGGSATLRIDVSKAGHYTFYCPIDHHRQSGMEGVLIVGSSASPSNMSTGVNPSPSTTSTGAASASPSNTSTGAANPSPSNMSTGSPSSGSSYGY